jgi:hypothetical protein
MGGVGRVTVGLGRGGEEQVLGRTLLARWEVQERGLRGKGGQRRCDEESRKRR